MRTLLLLSALAIGCKKDGDTQDSGDSGDCAAHAVVTDIDETLTTSDGEWLDQLLDPEHDPAMRPDANTLMQGYAEKGYRVAYVTARGDDLVLLDGRSATEATVDWLILHGFPNDHGLVFLADGIGASGDDAVEYKAGVLADLQADGIAFDYAYGNADTDIWAFQEAGIPDDRIFLVGALAGTMGVIGIQDEDAYTNHLAAHLQTVEDVTCP